MLRSCLPLLRQYLVLSNLMIISWRCSVRPLLFACSLPPLASPLTAVTRRPSALFTSLATRPGGFSGVAYPAAPLANAPRAPRGPDSHKALGRSLAESQPWFRDGSNSKASQQGFAIDGDGSRECGGYNYVVDPGGRPKSGEYRT